MAAVGAVAAVAISAVAAVAYLAVTGVSIRDLYKSWQQVIQVKEEGLVTVQSLQPVLTPITPIAGKIGCDEIGDAEGALDAEDVASIAAAGVKVAKDTAKVGVKIVDGGLVTGAVGGLVLGGAAGQVAQIAAPVAGAATFGVKAAGMQAGLETLKAIGGTLSWANAKTAEFVHATATQALMAQTSPAGVVAQIAGVLSGQGAESVGLLTGAAVGGAVVGLAIAGAVVAVGAVIAVGALLFAGAVAVEAAQTAVEAAKLGLEFAQATQALNADQDWEPVVGKAKAWRVPGGW